MRLRNIKGAQEIVSTSSYVISNPQEYRGKWNILFANHNPIHLEIGMGKGNFLIENAIKYPNINFIGIEKYYSVLVRTTDRLKTLDLPNLKIIVMDAKEIEQIFDKEINTIYLNFSDPWPKKKHEKRRLTSEEFLKKYDNLFTNKKHIMQKTDNRKLFEYSLISCTDYGYHIENISCNLYEDRFENNIPTEYETKFVNKGYTIYFVEFQK